MARPALSLADSLAALAVVTFWGLNFVAAKVAVTAIPPFMVMTLRFTGVALLLTPFTWPRRDQWRLFLVLAVVLGVGHFSLLFFALHYLDAASQAVIVQLGVPFSVLLAWVVLGERPDRRRLAGLALAFGGVILLAGRSRRIEQDWAPMLVAVTATLMWAAANIVVKRLGPVSPITLNGWVSALAAPMVLTLSLLFEHGQGAALRAAGWQAWAGVAFSTLGSSVVAYTLWYRLLSRHPVSRVVPFTLLAPVIGFTAGVTVLGEAAGPGKVIGGLVTLAGVAIIELWPERSRTKGIP
jgi:O-acetylserine/cysteine efflux transporter